MVSLPPALPYRLTLSLYSQPSTLGPMQVYHPSLLDRSVLTRYSTVCAEVDTGQRYNATSNKFSQDSVTQGVKTQDSQTLNPTFVSAPPVPFNRVPFPHAGSSYRLPQPTRIRTQKRSIKDALPVDPCKRIGVRKLCCHFCFPQINACMMHMSKTTFSEIAHTPTCLPTYLPWVCNAWSSRRPIHPTDVPNPWQIARTPSRRRVHDMLDATQPKSCVTPWPCKRQ